jgi:hypothetical protein
MGVWVGASMFVSHMSKIIWLWAIGRKDLHSYSLKRTLLVTTTSVPKYKSFLRKIFVLNYKLLYITNEAFIAFFPIIPLTIYFSFFF